MFFLLYNVVSVVMRIIGNMYVLYISFKMSTGMLLLRSFCLSNVDLGYQSAYFHFVVYRLQR